ncbi:hypothetical protein CSA56_04790 [candidate division KSB3 bacterium]|uniref:O-antigen ligase-related domain-containing protein n=1 Tax=candidate division KSB3 bacterium TaxID=2044937 RepID=A0A2G6KKE3_9BACT|nr:MAG: hypothetical protein CSA56_04790 [candidate division KSB3 bacterium]
MNNHQDSHQAELKKNPLYATSFAFSPLRVVRNAVNKLSRESWEILITGISAFIFVQFYKSSPLVITIVVVGVVIIVPIFIKKTEYAAIFLAVVLPFQDFHIVSIIHFKRLIIWSISAYLLMRHLLQPQVVFIHSLARFTKILIVFITALIVSLIKAASELHSSQFLTVSFLKSAALSEVLVIIEGSLIVYLVYYSIRSWQQLRKLFVMAILGSAVISCLGIIQYYHEGPPDVLSFLYAESYQFYGRAVSVFLSPNYLGGFLAPMIIIAFVFLIWGPITKNVKLYLILPALLLNLWAITLTFSRGAMLQVFFGIVVVEYLYARHISAKTLSWKVVFMALFAIGIILAGIGSYDIYMRSRLSGYSEASYRRAFYNIHQTNDFYRKRAAVRALQTFAKHPIFGTGYGTFQAKGLAGLETFGMAVHNQYLKILAEMGLFGFIPFLILLGIVIKTCFDIWKKLQERQEVRVFPFLCLSGMGAIAFGYLVADFLVTLNVSGYLWIFSGSIFTVQRLCQENNTL